MVEHAPLEKTSTPWMVSFNLACSTYIDWPSPTLIIPISEGGLILHVGN